MSRNFVTDEITFFIVASISASVVNRPMPKRREVCARPSSTPMARRTYEGSKDALVQAEPLDTAVLLANDMRRLSPSTQANDKFTFPTYRCDAEPRDCFSCALMRFHA